MVEDCLHDEARVPLTMRLIDLADESVVDVLYRLQF